MEWIFWYFLVATLLGFFQVVKNIVKGKNKEGLVHEIGNKNIDPIRKLKVILSKKSILAYVVLICVLMNLLFLPIYIHFTSVPILKALSIFQIMLIIFSIISGVYSVSLIYDNEIDNYKDYIYDVIFPMNIINVAIDFVYSYALYVYLIK